MKVIVPVAITPERILATSLPERHDSEPELYDASKNYGVDQQCLVGGTVNRIYQSIAADNLGHAPPDSPLHWVSVGASNRGAWNDEYANTQSIDQAGAGFIQIDIESGLTTSVVLFGVKASSVHFQLIDPAGTLLAESMQALLADDCLDWFDYCFKSPEYSDRCYWTYPFLPQGRLRIRLSMPGGGAGLGKVVCGQERLLGQTLFPLDPGVLDFSEKSTDARGRVTLKKGLNADLLRFSLQIEEGAVDKVHRILKSLLAQPCAWLVDNRTDKQASLDGSYHMMCVLGFFTDLKLSVAWSSEYALELEGLV